MGRRPVHAGLIPAPSRSHLNSEIRLWQHRACRSPGSNWPTFRLAFRPIEIASVHLPSKTRNLLRDFQAPSRVRVVESSGFMERAMGIEPTSEAWEGPGESGS